MTTTGRILDEDNNGINCVHLGGAFWLTWCRPEHPDPAGVALLTVDGRDNAITAAQARAIAADLLLIADRIDGME